ncbi:F-box protein CPR1-like [Silene latifolia]|uniref:F-box protein CPR1-like n=1 Tax=Silene latifolia TaxID=37657 RepID=UPI003D780537
MRLPVKDTPRWTQPRIFGSYNGLVAVSFEDQLILWNPLTRKHSSVNWYIHDDDGGHRLLYGLCYDVGRDEYKVVIGSNYQSPPVSPSNFDRLEIYETIHVSLCNFKDGRWGTVNSDSLGIRLLDRWLYIGKVVYGLPHWVVEFYDFIDPFVKKEILYFDLKDEKFKQMKRPYNNRDDKKLLGLAAIDDENQLGCVFRDGFSSSIEVWVMKEYGNSESWTNLFTIPSLYTTANHSSIMDMDVMGFTPNGELLLYVNGNRLWIYDFQKGNCHAIKYKDLKFDVVITYEPKLISPPEPSKHLNKEYKDEDEVNDDTYY